MSKTARGYEFVAQKSLWGFDMSILQDYGIVGTFLIYAVGALVFSAIWAIIKAFIKWIKKGAEK